MKSILCLLSVFWIGLSVVLLLDHPLAAQEVTEEPLIRLSVADQPLVEVLDRITADTGYQFNINPAWERHRVSATLLDVPVERGLKRLLRSLNHSIVWETNRVVSIMVYGKVEPGRDDGAISFAPPPRDVPPEEPPAADEPGEVDEMEADEALSSDDDGETATTEAGQPGGDSRAETAGQTEGSQ